VAREDSRELARALYPHIELKSRQQILAYRELADAQLFTEKWVGVNVARPSCRATRRSGFRVPGAGRA